MLKTFIIRFNGLFTVITNYELGHQASKQNSKWLLWLMCGHTRDFNNVSIGMGLAKTNCLNNETMHALFDFSIFHPTCMWGNQPAVVERYRTVGTAVGTAVVLECSQSVEARSLPGSLGQGQGHRLEGLCVCVCVCARVCVCVCVRVCVCVCVVCVWTNYLCLWIQIHTKQLSMEFACHAPWFAQDNPTCA